MNGRRLGQIFLFSIVLLNLYYFVPYISRSYVKIEKLKREQKELEEKIEIAKNRIEDYNKSIDTLEDDFQREMIARNKLQMIRENEEIYRFINLNNNK